MELTVTEAKRAAQALRTALAESDIDIAHGKALELVSRQLGFRDWNTASASLPQAGVRNVGPPVPVLRILDEALARRFYVDYLGFQVCWEHRFEPGLPLYMRVRRDDAELDLSGHYGDGTPGGVVWLPVADVAALHRDVTSRNELQPLRPGIEVDSPGGPTMEVIDPFSNALRFCQEEG